MGKAITDTSEQFCSDLERVRSMLPSGPTTLEVAQRLGVLPMYARRLLVALEGAQAASLVCGRWFVVR